MVVKNHKASPAMFNKIKELLLYYNVEVDKQQHLYYLYLRHEHNAGYILTRTKAFLKGPRFTLWYDDYYQTIVENFLSNY